MATTDIPSQAFRRATLASERLRISGLIVALVALLVVVLARALWLGRETEVELLPKAIVLFAALIAYETFMLTVVSRMIQADRELPPWTWILNVLIETAFPTMALAVLTGSSFMGPYRALVAPAILIYFFFIILSTLRLSPSLCALTGLFSAMGYWAVVAYTYVVYPIPPEGSGAFSLQVYITYGVFLLIGGFTAGGVARQIRTHVAAALREAEVRRQMDQVKRDLSIARSIQQGLLPKEPPDTEGFEVAGWSQPADETGGDYYDWQRLPDGRVVISLADVTGHGIGPALVSAVCRAYVRATFPFGSNLGTLMTRINTLLVEDLQPNRFVTLAVGILDPKTAMLHLLSAGQGPILVYKAADDYVEDYDAHGIPLGITSAYKYGSSQEIPLLPGDLVVLVTDGFFEWEGPNGEQFGIDRLKRVIQSSKDLPARELITRLHSEVMDFAGGMGQKDDLTAVVVKCMPARA